MSKTLRYLRIAFSITCGIAFVLLIALWVRSCWWVDQLGIPMTQSLVVAPTSSPHKIIIMWLSNQPSQFGVVSTSVADWMEAQERYSVKPVSSIPTFSISRHMLIFPHWFAAILTATLATAPWLRFRFSLRTLLIATTLVAVVLGLVVWAVR